MHCKNLRVPIFILTSLPRRWRPRADCTRTRERNDPPSGCRHAAPAGGSSPGLLRATTPTVPLSVPSSRAQPPLYCRYALHYSTSSIIQTHSRIIIIIMCANIMRTTAISGWVEYCNFEHFTLFYSRYTKKAFFFFLFQKQNRMT